MIGDFHSHSNNSDGIYSVYEVIDIAYKKGLKYLALTDHDSIDGNLCAMEYGKKRGINVIPGIELSTRHNNEAIHILGYFKNLDMSKSKELIDYLAMEKKIREERAKKIIELLDLHFGIKISYEALLKNADGIIARPHIAKTIIEAGYPYTKDEIFAKMIGNDCPAYVPSTHLETNEGIELLKRNNCLVVIAHPILIKKTSLQYFISLKPDGIEAIYPKNTFMDTNFFKAVAKENNMFYTAGSDFHGFIDDSHHELATCTLKDDEIKIFLERLINYEKI